jgi:hypothetical protein
MNWVTPLEMVNQIKDGQIAETTDEQWIQRRGNYIFWIDDTGRVDTSKGFDGVFVLTFKDTDFTLFPLIYEIEKENWYTESMEEIVEKVMEHKRKRGLPITSDDIKRQKEQVGCEV